MIKYKVKFDVKFNDIITQENFDTVGLGYLIIKSGDLEVELDFHEFSISKVDFDTISIFVDDLYIQGSKRDFRNIVKSGDISVFLNLGLHKYTPDFTPVCLDCITFYILNNFKTNETYSEFVSKTYIYSDVKAEINVNALADRKVKAD